MGFKEEMLCSKSHEYVIKQDDKYVIGLTDYAIEQLGDIVFLDLRLLFTYMEMTWTKTLLLLKLDYLGLFQRINKLITMEKKS